MGFDHVGGGGVVQAGRCLWAQAAVVFGKSGKKNLKSRVKPKDKVQDFFFLQIWYDMVFLFTFLKLFQTDLSPSHWRAQKGGFVPQPHRSRSLFFLSLLFCFLLWF